MVKTAAPKILMWFFQHLHRPCEQYDVELGFLHELLEVQNEQQELVETVFNGGSQQGLAILVIDDECKDDAGSAGIGNAECEDTDIGAVKGLGIDKK